MRTVKNAFVILLIAQSLWLTGRVVSMDKLSVSQVTMLIDSIENQLVDTLPQYKANLHLELAQLYQYIDNSRSVSHGMSAIKWKAVSQDPVLISQVYQLLANYYTEQERVDSAYKYHQLAMVHCNNEHGELLKHMAEKYQVAKRANLESTSFFSLKWVAVFVLLILILVLSFVVFRKTMVGRGLNKDLFQLRNQFKVQESEINAFSIQVEQTVFEQTKHLRQKLDKATKREVVLRKKLKQVEETDYLKNAFLGSLSHEIRTPLSGIVGFSNLLQTELAVQGNTNLYEYTNHIEQSSVQLTSLLDNIIDISSIEANMLEVELQSDDFTSIVREVRDVYEKRAKEKGLVFKVKTDPDLPKLKADNIKLTKVLNILADNAVKYTESGFVTITTAHNKEKNLAVIQVKDTGYGIDAETLKALLFSFQYGSKGKVQIYQGKGIGLTLAHRFVTMMGGNISITSHEHQGTTVTLAIPCVGDQSVNTLENALHPEGATLLSAPDMGQISIFIVEDDRMNRLVLEKMLKKAGKLTLAVDGEDAIKKVENAYNQGQMFQVMLFDIQLPPPWDGVALMKLIKQRLPDYKKIPFIAQTAFAMGGDKDSYMEAGFDDYISKPINKTELLTIIQKHLVHREH